MSWIEMFVVTLGLSLDIFAAVECQGALVAQIRKKHLLLISALLSLWQVISLYIGSFLASLLLRYDLRDDSLKTGRIIAVAILICLGIRMIVKAWKNDRIQERRVENLGVGRFVRLGAVSSIYTLLVGMAFGFLNCNVLLMLVMIVLFTIAVVVLGMYIGYRFGFEQKTKVYIIGGILLIAGGIDVIIRYIWFV